MISEDKSIPESHRIQREQGQRKAFRTAGIPDALHDANLSSIVGGTSIVDWLKEAGGVGLLERGETWVLRTHGRNSGDMMPLIARAILLRQTRVRVVKVTRLIRAIEERDYDLFDDLGSKFVLFLEGFFTASAKPVERPFTAYQRAQIEDLIVSRKQDGHANVLQVVNTSLRPPRLEEWWTDNLLSVLNPDHQFTPEVK